MEFQKSTSIDILLQMANGTNGKRLVCCKQKTNFLCCKRKGKAEVCFPWSVNGNRQSLFRKHAHLCIL
jgi:hypothetical protein